MFIHTFENFFTLIRSGLYGTVVSANDLKHPLEWEKIMNMAEQQTLLGLVIDAVSRMPDEFQPPKEVKSRMLQISLGIMQSHLLLDKTVAQVVEFYRKEGIEGVLLKGQGIARYYHNPKLRQCGDIDFYIGKQNYFLSVQLAQSIDENSKMGTTETVKHFHFNIGRVSVELHRIAALMHTPVKNKKFDLWLCNQLEDLNKLRSLTINGTNIHVPSVTFDAFFIFYHAWYHFFRGGIGLRQLCDWSMALQHNAEKINHKELKEVLEKFKLMKAWQLFGKIAVEKLGLDSSLMPFYNSSPMKKQEWVFQRIMNGGNFGYYVLGKPFLIEKIPIVERKLFLIKRLVSSYFNILSIIPVEMTCYSLDFIRLGTINTIKQLFSSFFKTIRR